LRTSERGVDFIKKHETYSATPYRDNGESIGYGHQNREKYKKLTAKEAYIILRKDIQKAEIIVKMNVKIPLKQNQLDALVSFVFNVGSGAFRKSMLLKKLNAKDPGVIEEFDRWVYSGGKKLPGLIKRREQEKEMYNE